MGQELGLFFEKNAIIPAFVPIDTTGAAVVGDYINMRDIDRIVAVILMGAWAGGTPAVTFNQATSAAGAGAKGLPFNHYYHGVALTTDRMTKVAATNPGLSTATFNLAATLNKFYAVEIRAEDMDTNGGFNYAGIAIASPGANADLIAGFYILPNLRYPQGWPTVGAVGGPPTAIV